MLSELKQTCSRLTYMKARRSHYLTHVKSQLCYAWEAPSHVYKVQLLKRIEGVQRGARRCIMMSRRGELSYKESLLALDLLPLTLHREVTHLVFLYKALFGYVNVDFSDYIVCFVSQSRSNSAD